MKNVALTLILASIASFGATGCEWVALGIALSEDDEPDCFDCCEGDCFDPPDPIPPTVDVSIADWPPVGPNGTVTVSATSQDGDLSSATFSFRFATTTFFDDSFSGSVFATGSELGEGFGTMSVTVENLSGASTTRTVTDLLVDLTPPTAYFDETVLPAAGSTFNFWMADAWVVSGCRLTVGDSVVEEQLEPGYPDTLGVEWDFSLVTVPVEQLPMGTFVGQLELWDAAGNTAVVDVPLTIDGIPPEVTVPSPEEGAALDGTFELTVTASDDVPLPVSLEIRVGGALVATGTSPATTILLSTADFPQGPTEISVIAVDEAGNRSPALVRNVVFGPVIEEPPPAE